MKVAKFTQLEERVLTHFGPDGQEIIGVPQLQRLALLDSKLRTPHSVNWNIQVDREWIKNLFVRVGYQQRQGRREFVLNPMSEPGPVATGSPSNKQTSIAFSTPTSPDLRTGLQFLLIGSDRNFVGPLNLAGRFPTFVSFDMQVMKTISLPGRFNKYRAHLGLKVFNVTNHFNPRDFQNNLASDNFGNFSNGVGRKFGTRISFSKK